MSAQTERLGISKLSVAERIELVEEIWDSIVDDASSLEIPPSHKEELDRRIAEYEANPTAGSSWDEVKARLQARS